MARHTLLKLVTATVGVASFLPTFASAQQVAAPSSAPAPTSPIFAPSAAEPKTEKAAPAPAAPRRNRVISSEVAAALAAAAPKYEPQAPKPPPKPESELVDLRDVDKPKNTIVRLKPYVVQEPKPPIFTERSIHTEKGLTDIAMRRYISDADRALNRWTLPLFGTSKEARAMAMYAEEERLRNMANLEETAIAASKSDAAGGSYIRKEAQKTYLRSADFGWSSGEPR